MVAILNSVSNGHNYLNFFSNVSKILETFITILISVITIGIYNLVENVLRKNKKLSKVRQNRKTVIAVYDFFFFFFF